ncbi:MAG: hypothetical protein KAU20_06165, partial [Nanoarchaeota archaeon]|nr:hypothetical protein [Nanoarchaeota archaeon]
VKTVAFSGTEVILEHNDEVTETLWNRSVENGASSYYLPAVAIAMNAETSFNYDDQKELYGCIPPSNPAAGSANEEYFLCQYEYYWEWVSGAGDGYVRLSSGTVLGSETVLDTHVLGSGGSGSRTGTFLAGTCQYYTSVLGSAFCQYFKMELLSQNTAPRSIYKIMGLNVYYRKYN